MVTAVAALLGATLYAVAQGERQERRGGFRGFGGLAMGVVSSVQGKKVTVKLEDSDETRTVLMGDETRIIRRAKASIADLEKGAKVQIQGRFDENGVWFLPSRVTLNEELGTGAGGGGPLAFLGRGAGGGLTSVGQIVHIDPEQGQMQVLLNVSLKDTPDILRESTIQPREIQPGEKIMAIGRPGDEGIDARLATVGEVENPMRAFGGGFGRGREGRPGRDGQRPPVER